MTRRLVLAAALAAGSSLLSGCVDPNMQPIATAPVRPVATCGFQVINNSGITVHTLNFSSSAFTSWGADQLGSSVLPPGRSVSFRPGNAGNYDFRVIWTNGRAAELRQVNTCRTPNVIVTNGGLMAR